tara:strand:- start:3223 stop:3807 length:585 start_codon:yes stop_codon:yes gene_type:complete
MQALSPSKAETPDFKAAFQRLKYQPSYAELKRLGNIIENSLGRWGRLGYAIDRSRQTALGKLNKKGVSDIMGMALMVAYLRPIAKGINRLFSPNDQSEHIVPGEHIIERPHLDHRYFSALFGNRDTIRTEVYSNAEWHELPVGLDSIAIFPGKLAERDLGIVPTLHRVVQTVSHRPEAYVDSRTSNVTVLLGAV